MPNQRDRRIRERCINRVVKKIVKAIEENNPHLEEVGTSEEREIIFRPLILAMTRELYPKELAKYHLR